MYTWFVSPSIEQEAIEFIRSLNSKSNKKYNLINRPFCKPCKVVFEYIPYSVVYELLLKDAPFTSVDSFVNVYASCLWFDRDSKKLLETLTTILKGNLTKQETKNNLIKFTNNFVDKLNNKNKKLQNLIK